MGHSREKEQSLSGWAGWTAVLAIGLAGMWTVPCSAQPTPNENYLPSTAPPMASPAPAIGVGSSASLAALPDPDPPPAPPPNLTQSTAQLTPPGIGTQRAPVKRPAVPRIVEEYGREFYPGFFPELPAAAELLEGQELLRGEAVLEEQLVGPPEPGFPPGGRVTLTEKEARRLRARPPYRVGGPLLPNFPPKPPSMWHLGLFCWRDDTREIEGRGPYRPDMPPMEHELCPGTYFGGPEVGLTWQSQDDFFRLTFHDLTQLDLREPFEKGDPLHGGFVIPRQRWYFEGKVGDYANFVTSINRGYSTLDLLDAYVDYNINPEWLQFRVGRMKTPSMYEYIDMDEANLIGPERSLFAENFAGNRQLGAMAHGFLNDRQFLYAIGAFNGQRRSFEDFNSSFDFFSYLDYRPFRKCDICWLEGVHLVGAYNFGEERQPLSPAALRTMNQLSNSDAAAFVSPTFLEFNTNAFENGPRAQWDAEFVYYFRSVGFLAGAQGGYQDYSVAKSLTSPLASTRQNATAEFLGIDSSTRTQVPLSGWGWQGWWFLTGEEITRRIFLVEPRRPFGYYNGALNPGALELFTKVTRIELGNQVFTGGIADPKLWTNRATNACVGWNWYLNHYVKFTAMYEHDFMGSPVILNPTTNAFTKHFDVMMVRTQLFF
jgi:phosphate-selective porin OprO/OprP